VLLLQRTAIDLFGLLLGALRVLLQMHAGAVSITAPGEIAIVEAFRSAADDAGDDMMHVVRPMAKSVLVIVRP
jgi:hypothetical protein